MLSPNSTNDEVVDKPRVKSCEEALATHSARLAELRGLVARIAADIGLEAGGVLEAEVQALDRRLEGVRGALDTMQEANLEQNVRRDQVQCELLKTKQFLDSVQKSLEAVEGAGEDTLATLRNHLVALGRTESLVANVKDKCCDLSDKPDSTSDASVVEILELWQQVFRETFQQYHRLSAQLVRSEDGAFALRLWQEYLHHVQSFLSGAVPADFDGLCETQRVCEVHQNLLTSQHAVLLKRRDKAKMLTEAVQEQFNSLANLHNETLARIMERHSEVSKRLLTWHTYRQTQSRLLSWLRDMTHAQSRLQLRYLHLRRVPRLLEQLRALLTQVSGGRAQLNELLTQQPGVISLCEDHLAASVRMESVAISDRIQNLEAGLKSWEDFLLRVLELQKTLESQVSSIESVCDSVSTQLKYAQPASVAEAPARLERCQELRHEIAELSTALEELGVIQDQLKECVSVQDGKGVSQRVWLLSQRQAELEHQLLVTMHQLEERAELGHSFVTRSARFLNWGQDLLNRFEQSLTGTGPLPCVIDAESRAKRVEAEAKAEVSLKSRDFAWLETTGRSIIESAHLTTPETSQTSGRSRSSPASELRHRLESSQPRQDSAMEVQRRLEECSGLWERVNALGSIRAERRARLAKTKDDLTNRLEELRIWLSGIESALEAPLVLEKGSKKAVDKVLKEYETLHQKIQAQSSNAGEVLNLCELLLQDPTIDSLGVDVGEFSRTVDTLERRWKAVCVGSSERKSRIIGAWELLQQLAKLCQEHSSWLTEREGVHKELKRQTQSPQMKNLQNLTKMIEAQSAQLQAKAPAKRILDSSYSKLAQNSRFTPESLTQVAGPGKAVINRWQALEDQHNALESSVCNIARLRDEFLRAHSNSLLMLSGMSARLTQLELHPDATVPRIDELRQSLEADSGVLSIADKTGLELMKICSHPDDVLATQEMVDEYQFLWKDILARITSLRERSTAQSKHVQVSTLPSRDSSAQSSAHAHRLTSRGAYALELDVALRECMEHLGALERLMEEPEGRGAAPTHHTVAKMVAAATSSVELAQHLSETVLECGLSADDARTDVVSDVVRRFELLLTDAKERERQLRDASERGRLTCPLCTNRNWQQLDNDLWRLEQWVQYAAATLRTRRNAPTDMEALEDAIEDLRELLLDLDSHKSIVASLNIVGEHLADHTTDGGKARDLRERLRGLNALWDGVCAEATRWQDALQHALMQNSEFHETVEELVTWLGTTESLIRHSEPVDLSQDSVIIQAHYDKFRDLSAELDRCEPRVTGLQEAAVQLLERGGDVREKLTALRLRLTGLKRLVRVYLLKLGAALGRDPSELTVHPPPIVAVAASDSTSEPPLHPTGGDVDTAVLRRGVRFLARVVRAALPIQALMLLLLGAATLVGEEDYNCSLSNSARFHPYHPHQPPPI